MKFIIEEVRPGESSWRLVDDDGNVLAWAGVTFTSLAAADHAAHEFRMKAVDADYHIYEEAGGSWRWTAWWSEANCVAASGTAFTSKDLALEAAEDVLKRAGSALGP